MNPVSSMSSSNSPIPPAHTSSPLKRKRPPHSDKAEYVAGAIFRPKAARSIFPIESSKNYLSDMPEFLKVVAEKIEESLGHHNHSPMYLSLIRSLILEISKNEELKEEQKLAELGIIYYYIVSDKKITSGHSSMVKMRLLDIETELLKLKAQHRLLENKKLKKLFPSGTIAYLLRCFVRMIFTPDGNFNLGGCHAVQQLLNRRLAIFLSEEQRLQILSVTDKLIKDSNFLNLFIDPFDIHPDLEELILIDMKLPSDEKMHFTYVRWDLLTALFTVISGQYTGETNCYAVATASNMMHNHCEIALTILIDALKTGTLLVDNQAIPILPLLESRRQYGVDFQKELSDNAVENLVAFSVANAVLNPEERASQETQVQLRQKIESHFGPDAAYAREISLSLKQNFLQQIITVFFQFQGLNIGANKSLEKKSIDSKRGCFFFEVCNVIEHSFSATPILKNILEKFNEAFFKHFFFVGYLNWNNQIVGNKIVFDFHPQGLLFDATVDYSPFNNILRLFFLKENSFTPVDTIENFNQILIEIAEMIKQTENRPTYQMALNQLIDFFKMDLWKKRVAQFLIYRWNSKKSNLSAAVYENSNSLFLLQTGGAIEPIGNWLYKDSFLKSKCNIHSAASVKTMFIQMCKEINDFSAINADFFNQQDKKLLAGTESHIFNLTPLKFKKYWSNFALINKNVIAPAKKMWNQRPTDQEKISILQKICSEEETERILSHISQGRIGLRRYRKEVMQYLDESEHQNFSDAIEVQMQNIDINTFIKGIKTLLAKLNITLDSKSESQLSASLKKKSEKSGTPLFTPNQLAKLMRNALILSLKNAIFLPQYQLEEEICALYGFPQKIELGGLNWVLNLEEKPYEWKLILKYDVNSDDVALFIQNKAGIETFAKTFTEGFLKKYYFFLTK